MKILAISILLSACVPSTAGGVRDLGPAKSYSFTTQENYLKTYKKILEKTSKCNDAWMLTAQLVTQGDLKPESKSGTITVSLLGGLGKSVYKVFDVSEITQDTSKVVGYFSNGSAERGGKLLQKWALEDYAECSL